MIERGVNPEALAVGLFSCSLGDYSTDEIAASGEGVETGGTGS